MEAVKMLLEHFLIKHQRDQNIKALRVLIQEDMVSFFIGKEGKNINKLKDICRTQITVFKEPNGTKYRPVEIEGNIDDIIMTVKEINKSMEIFETKNKTATNRVDRNVEQNEISAKMVFPREIENSF